MTSNRSDLSFFPTYLWAMAIQAPVWLCAGLIWGLSMVALAHFSPVSAVLGGLGCGLFMWIIVGNLFAAASAWRRSGPLPTADRRAVRAAVEQACDKLGLVVLAESPKEVVLGPKRVLVRLRLQEVRVEFEGKEAKLSAPALSFGRVRKALGRALADR